MSTKKNSVDLPKRSRSPVVLEGEMFGEFQDWCLRTYGDSGKTKTVTRRKYNKILQTLSHTDESDPVYIESNHINAKFKFWVKSKGFIVGTIQGDLNKNGATDIPVLYVPIKATESPCSSCRCASDVVQRPWDSSPVLHDVKKSLQVDGKRPAPAPLPFLQKTALAIYPVMIRK
uniref:Nucleolar protein 4 n=1 Tax=Hucho hucho TaxID=62062 RepID=A0A4W5QBN6_9TELE